ncbi:MAG: exopolysaccharide Pel transporter PelG, partial [Spirochaetales bacterium]|nr:exopolysaccharide Pel transporter PelG [Spirochaetales bacterium]
MAGIGFELRKVVQKGSISSFFQIAVSGAMIVAGPWLMTIVTILLIQNFFSRYFTENIELFMGVIIYAYAFSLLIFGGSHYLITRRMSDLLYEKKERQAFGYVLIMFIPIVITSAAIASPIAFSFNLDIEHDTLFKLSTIIIFVSINCLWVIMLFVSVLKWYIKILSVYIIGLSASLFLILSLSKNYGVAGAALGFAAGQTIIVILLVMLCLIAWRPVKPDFFYKHKIKKGTNLLKTFNFIKKYRFLFFTGVFYYLGIWIDKLIFWGGFGETIPGTGFKIFEYYDIPVFSANLTMIPGLIFFTIYTETEFYTILRRFLLIIGKGLYTDIVESKNKILNIVNLSLKEQSLLQGIVSI